MPILSATKLVPTVPATEIMLSTSEGLKRSYAGTVSHKEGFDRDCR